MAADQGSSQVHRAHRALASTTFRHAIPCAFVALATLTACSSNTSRTLSATTTIATGGTTSTVVDAAAPTVASDVASTAAATSLAPTTLVAETVAPETVAPETVAPATPPPATAAPTTLPPVTAPSTTVPCRVVGEFPGNYYELNFSLRRGDCGPAVRTLQTYLNDVYGFSLGADSQFGPATASAVRDMQTRFFGAGSLVTGVLDRDTWTAMVGSDPPPEA